VVDGQEHRKVNAEFLSKLVVEDDGGSFVLREPLLYQSQILSGILTVPIGFPTDFASIPRGLWNILPPVGKYDSAAVCHDKLYRDGGFDGQPIDRGTADRVLREAMDVCGVGRLQRWLIYSGLRIGGWVVWKRYRSGATPEKGTVCQS
jgi:hypothetical protein